MRFLRHLLRHVSGQILVIWVGSPIHRCHVVKDFLARGAAARLQLEALPGYAPDTNPVEKLWRWLRQDVLKLHRKADDWVTLRATVRDFLDQFASGSKALLRYVGLAGDGKLAQALK